MLRVPWLVLLDILLLASVLMLPAVSLQPDLQYVMHPGRTHSWRMPWYSR
jgi:hypothetical protein